MNTSNLTPPNPTQTPPRDDFDDLLAEKFADPSWVAAFEDAQQRARLVADLRDCRKAHHLRQRQVAEHMGVGQPTISEFEGCTDAHLSTLQRYARALGARLSIRIDMPADQSWSCLVHGRYAAKSPASTERGTAVVKSPDSAWLKTWAGQTEARREPEPAVQ